MPPQKRKNNKEEAWLKHDPYKPGVSTSRITTRSQTAFARIRNSESEIKLFADGSRHHPPKKIHLMVTMKGEYGGIPRTILTRSTAQFLVENEELCEALQDYKKNTPPKTDGDLDMAQEKGPTPAQTPPAILGDKGPSLSQSHIALLPEEQNAAMSEDREPTPDQTPPAILGEKGPSLSQPQITVIPPKDEPEI
ncbi:hypothetical protein AVEN_184253-1 [Araneus ventricosus]|uniref:Uncharacterized protein n=1 Tax=Araneus ventricosus TaxID=182803 RepID=A0A4Y2GMJ7_ARAVE|nr:hypothetical protein AVEN_184253-1 [Araneus ventricosus]